MPLYKKILFFVSLLLIGHVSAQKTTIKDMRKQVSRLQQQIKEKERILLSSEKDVKAKLKNLDLLTAQINERKTLVSLLSKEVDAIDFELDRLSKEVDRNEKYVEKAKCEYAAALRRARNYGSLQDKLLFIVSADDFNSLLRRYRYTREYMNAHRKLADKLKLEILELENKRAEIQKVREDKMQSLEERKKEQAALGTLEDKQRKLLAELKRENSKVKKELSSQRNELNKLNTAIERAIEREIAERKRAEELAAKRREEENRKKRKTVTGKKEIPTVAKTNVGKMEKTVTDNSSSENRKMTGTFLQNKGKLPVPITGPYMLTGSFGPQNGVSGKGNVRIDYGGITLRGERGAKARAVFDGVVTSVVRADDFAFVIIRHGVYLSVYCKLTAIKVNVGDKVSARDIIADVATDASGVTTLLFQIRNEKVKLNPKNWLAL